MVFVDLGMDSDDFGQGLLISGRTLLIAGRMFQICAKIVLNVNETLMIWVGLLIIL